MEAVAAHTGYPAKFCQGNVDMRAVLGMSDDQIQNVITTVHARCSTDPDWDITLQDTGTSQGGLLPLQLHRVRRVTKMDDRGDDPYVVTGISLGLGERVFDEELGKLVRAKPAFLKLVMITSKDCSTKTLSD